jgi:hypothetical protein
MPVRARRERARVFGLATAFGSVPPDFTAATLVNLSAVTEQLDLTTLAPAGDHAGCHDDERAVRQRKEHVHGRALSKTCGTPVPAGVLAGPTEDARPLLFAVAGDYGEVTQRGRNARAGDELTMKAILLPLCTACVAALSGLAACSKLNSGQNEMSWARAALERNDRIEVVASDAQASTFTVRMKDTGELRVVSLDQLVAGPRLSFVSPAPPQGSPAAATATGTAEAGASAAEAVRSGPGAPAPVDHGPTAAAGEAATPAAAPVPQPTSATEPRVASANTSSEGAKPPRSESAAGAPPGHVLASGPGYTIKAADSKGATIRRVAAGGPAASATLERMHEPIICQGEQLKQIDNRNLEFDGDGVSAEDGCEIHITNSRIVAKGVGVLARSAAVHIQNSDVEGDSASVDASGGAQVYSSSSTFKGIRRRGDNAAFHDLGGNAWN